MPRKFHQETDIQAPAEFAFQWHERPGAFNRLAPPWEELRIVRKEGGLEDGAELVFQVKLAPGVWQKWHARHFDYEPGRQFCDEQLHGPFSSWRHVHRFEATGEESCTIIDDVDYRLPLEPLSNLAHHCFIEEKIKQMFAYRSERARRDIQRHYRSGLEPQRIAITGSTGLVGSQLAPFLTTGGHEVLSIVRSRKKVDGNSVYWNPARGIPKDEKKKLEGIDAVVHLAGEGIMGRWTEDKKRRIRESRVQGTRSLCDSLASLKEKPSVLVCASAVGFYGNRGAEEIREDAGKGEGFLADVAEEWEAAAGPAREAGIRVVFLRIGMVLSPQGGALATMLTPFKMGLGGRLGSGDQWVSWVSLDDLVAMVHDAIANDSLDGPVNAISPNPVTNRELTETLARVLKRPVGPPAPKVALQSLMSELAEEVLLTSAKVLPGRLENAGYQFEFTELEGALRHLLGRRKLP